MAGGALVSQRSYDPPRVSQDPRAGNRAFSSAGQVADGATVNISVGDCRVAELVGTWSRVGNGNES